MFDDKVDEKTIKYYFTSKEVDFINVVKKAFKGQALSKEEITFIKTFANENDNQKNRKLLFDLTSLNLKYNLKHKTATVKL